MSSIRDRIAAAEAKTYVSAVELALLTGFSDDTIYRAGKSGELPTIQLRGAMRFPRVEALKAMRRWHMMPEPHDPLKPLQPLKPPQPHEPADA